MCGVLALNILRRPLGLLGGGAGGLLAGGPLAGGPPAGGPLVGGPLAGGPLAGGPNTRGCISRLPTIPSQSSGGVYSKNGP